MNGPGRPRKPTALAKLDRDRPGRINEDVPTSPSGFLAPPSFLDATGKSAYVEMARIVTDMGIDAECDSPALVVYAVAYSRWRKALKGIEVGLTIDTPTTTKVNPCIAIANESERTMLRVMGQFGLTPSTRAGLRTGASNGKDDPLARWEDKVDE